LWKELPTAQTAASSLDFKLDLGLALQPSAPITIILGKLIRNKNRKVLTSHNFWNQCGAFPMKIKKKGPLLALQSVYISVCE
jgi:hypothetical protein